MTGAALIVAPAFALAQDDANASAGASVETSATVPAPQPSSAPGTLRAKFGALFGEHASGTPLRMPPNDGSHASGTPRMMFGDGSHASSTEARQEKMQERQDKMASTSAAHMQKAGDRGDQAIDKRIASLQALEARVSGMTRLSADEKATLSASLESTITQLTTLKAKIAAETDPTALKADLQSITKSYRVYALVLPQAAVVAAANRIETIVTQMQSFHDKLQTRITAASSAGTDTSAAAAALADFDAKVAAAATASASASASVAGLVPDNGDATVSAANTTKLKAARTQIQAAEASLKAARADIDTVLKNLKVTVSAKGSASAETHTQ